jgi:hypothetical protein
MLKSMNFKNDSPDEESQRLTEALRLIDMVLYKCYSKNKTKSADPNYQPRVVIYIGDLEYAALRSLCTYASDLTDASDQYRGFPIIRVMQESHCRAFCLNIPN